MPFRPQRCMAVGCLLHPWRRPNPARYDLQPGLVAISLAAILLLLSPAALAQVYVSGFGGINFHRDQNSNQVINADLRAAVEVDFDPGFAVGGSVGYAFEETAFGRFRVEIEGSYRENDVDNGRTLAGRQTFRGDTSAVAGLAMIYYDLVDVSEFVTPFIGAGAGVANIDSDVTYAPGDTDAPSTTAFGGNTETEFAWQAVAGFSMPVVPGIDLTLDGCYFATTDPDFDRQIIETGATTGRFDSEFETWQITAGFRFSF